MRLLLDTHVLAWWLIQDRRLSRRAAELIADPHNEVWVSAASAFETATKFRIGKWEEVRPLAMAFEPAAEAEGFLMLDISARHASAAGLLPGPHRDPFDRLLSAQALTEGMSLVTTDTMLADFGVQIVW